MKTIRPETFFTILILIFGTLLVFITPIGGGADEDTHIGRIWEMSTGELVPNRYLSTGPNYPYAFNQLSYRQDLNLNPISWETLKVQVFTKIDWDNFIHHTTRARYFFTLYLPQAFIMGVMGRLLDLPIGFFYFAIRLSYLFTYAALVYASVRIIPVGKWLLGLLSVTPMSLIQSSAISPDPVNNGIAFVFIAWVLYLNSPAKKIGFSRKDWFITALLTLSVCTLKLNTIPLLFILFLIPRVKFGSTKWLISFIVVAFISVVVVCLGWNYLTASELLDSTTIDTYNVSEQIKGIFADPIRFFTAVAQTIQTQTPRYFRDWVGASGYGYWPLPESIYWITMIVILLAIVSDSMDGLLNLRKRIIAVSTFLIVFLGTIVLFYLLYNPPGTYLIPGVQGRYFLFIAPLLLIAILPNQTMLRLGSIWLQAGSALVASLTVGALFMAYHFTCGSAYYSPGLCSLPRYKNWSPQTSLPLTVSAAQPASQSFTAKCDNLTQINLWIRNKSASIEPIEIRVRNADSEKLVIAQHISPDDIPSSGWLDIDFSTLPDSKNTAFILEISPAGSSEQPNLELGYTSRNEYLEGQLSIQNEIQTGDLLFKYGCSVGIDQLLHPNRP